MRTIVRREADIECRVPQVASIAFERQPVADHRHNKLAGTIHPSLQCCCLLSKNVVPHVESAPFERP